MTTAADDRTVERAFEAILAGRPAPEGAAGLAAFTEAVRSTATSPGRPSAALAELLATGLLVDQSSPSARTARSAGTSPSRGSRGRIRRRTAMLFPALLAKILSAGAVAQAATGATVVVVAFTGAGAAGILPDPVQDTFTSIVSDETEELPVEETAVEETPVEEAPVEDATADEPVVEEPPAEGSVEQKPEDVVAAWMEAPIDGSFGAWVSAAKNDPTLRAAIQATGRNFGSYVSERAHQKDLTDEDLAAEGVDPEELTDGTTEDGAVVEDTPEADAPEDQVVQTERTTEDRGNGGNGGNGGGRGNGGGNGNGRN
jgi:hypothetical protein